MSDYQRHENNESMTRLESLSPFLQWINDRLSNGESMAAVGLSLGVSHACVSRWLSGKRPVPRMALILGGLLMREPTELSPGLPKADVQKRVG